VCVCVCVCVCVVRRLIEGYIELRTRQTHTTLMEFLPRAHITPRVYSQKACIAYCKDERKRLLGPFQKGVWCVVHLVN
jgi:hypothetical protein